ncbi:hypothetical protein Tco_1352548 [Tanacetum coccineum]
MTTLTEFMIMDGADNRPPMLEKSMYDSWKSHLELYIENRENRRMILDSVQNGPLVWPTIVKENGTIRKRSLPPDAYAIVNHHKVAKEIWDRVKLLMQGTKLSLQERECLDVPVFTQGVDLIACLNKAMAFLSAVAASRFPSTNNQLRTSSNLRNQATIQYNMLLCNKFKRGKDKVMLVLAIRVMLLVPRGNNAGGLTRVVKCYNYQGEGNMARQCTQSKRPRNAAWFKDKAMLAEAQESGQILDEEQQAFLTDPGIPDGQASQTTIPNNVAFQIEDLDAYDYDCDDVSNAKAVLMADLSNYGSDVISKVPHYEPYHNDMDNQSVHAMQDFEQTPVVDFLDNKITSYSNIIPYSQYLQETLHADEKANQEKNNESLTAKLERYKERVKTFEQRLNIDLSTREKKIDSQMDDMIKEKLTLKQQIDSLEQNLSNQIKEKESLLQTFTVFKNESKEKESKYMDKEIDLEKKIKELDNIVYKVGQSAQTVHIQHVVIPVIDDEETLIFKEVSRSKMPAKQNDPISKEKKINTTPINYVELNRLSKDFAKRFVPQQELELPKVNLVNTSLKKLKYHLGKFDTVVKKRITHDAITEGEWGFEHTKAVFLNEIIPFLKTLKDIFNIFDKDLLNEKDKSCNNQNALEIPKYFENNDLKAQLQAKDTTIRKLKEHIKSIRENDKEEKVKQDMDEIETTNIELEHSVAKLLSENGLLHKEIEHLKKIYKDQFDSIKMTRALSKEHSDSLIAQLNSKSMENVDLKGQIQEKVFVTTSLQNELRRLKGKHVLDNATTITNATTIAPGMFKLDIEPISYRLKNIRDAHEDYLKKTIENTDTIHGLVERARK